ncbi:MAG: hypothetical protein GF355_00815 [Candidatus Eisenbacteria bacterium]|nr:hypothetical protein [Candidatus Eisenbacteria bacterium]
MRRMRGNSDLAVTVLRRAGLAFLTAVLAAAAVNAAAAGDFLISCTNPVGEVPLGTTLYEAEIPIKSTSAEDDSIDVMIDATVPFGWSVGFCQASTGICYFEDARIGLPAGAEDTILVDFFPDTSQEGFGSAFLEFRSANDPWVRSYCAATLYVDLPVPDVGQYVECPGHVRFVEGPFVLTEYNVPISRVGADNDNINVRLDTQDLPGDWFAQFCQVSTGICYLDEATLSFPPGAEDTIRVDITTGADPAQGDARLFVSSEAVPSYWKHCFFRVYDRAPAGAPEAFAENRLRVRIAPNPMQQWTGIAFDMPAEGRLRAEIFTPDGRRVHTLADMNRPAGPVTLPWDGRDAAGRPAAPGIYLVRIATPEGSGQAKLLLAR